MLDGIDLDPYVILGLARDAPPEAIREAFRHKSLKHHPDRGGDEWAFRIVVRAYEAITSRKAPETPSPRPTPDPGTDPISGDTPYPIPPGARWGPVRPGVADRGIDRPRLVHVEVVWIQLEVEDVFALLGSRPEGRQLGGWLTLTWPDPDLPDDPRALPFADRILMALNAAFDEIRLRPGTLSARSQIDSGRFMARLQYPSGPAARDAFKHLHTSLRARGLGAHQWTRILTVPRRSP